MTLIRQPHLEHHIFTRLEKPNEIKLRKETMSYDVDNVDQPPKKNYHNTVSALHLSARMFCFGHHPLLQLAALYQSDHHKMPAVQISYHLLTYSDKIKKERKQKVDALRVVKLHIKISIYFHLSLSLTRDHLCFGRNETIPEVIKKVV